MKPDTELAEPSVADLQAQIESLELRNEDLLSDLKESMAEVQLAIDDDAALLGVRRAQPKVIAQRSRERIAMRGQAGTRRQQRKHCGVHRRNALE